MHILTTKKKKENRILPCFFANCEGFTLVELMVVIVILGILAAILVPSLLGYVDKFRREQVQKECQMAVTTAQSMYSSAYQLGQEKPATADILSAAKLAGSISHMDTAVEDNDAVVNHLTYTNNNIIVTYCREYLTAGDSHEALYSFVDGPDGTSDDGWTIPTYPPTVDPVPDSETETETETSTETSTETETETEELYFIVDGIKFKCDGFLSDFLNSSVPSGTVYCTGSSPDDYVYYKITYDTTFGPVNPDYNVSIKIGTSTIHDLQASYYTGKYSSEYYTDTSAYWYDGMHVVVGDIYYDSITEKYYLSIADPYRGNPDEKADVDVLNSHYSWKLMVTVD